MLGRLERDHQDHQALVAGIQRNERQSGELGITKDERVEAPGRIDKSSLDRSRDHPGRGSQIWLWPALLACLASVSGRARHRLGQLGRRTDDRIR